MRVITLFIVIMMSFNLRIQSQTLLCNGFESRLQAGTIARITPGDANNVRTEPRADSQLVGQLDAGATFLVTGEAVCADGFVWLPISNPLLDISGYTVEGTGDSYWTEPASIEVLADNLALDFTPVTDSVSIEIMPQSNTFDHYREGGNPPFIQVTFDAPIFTEHLGTEIRIYPLEAFRDINPEFANLMDYDLQRFLSADTDLPTPFPLYTGASSLHTSHIQRIEDDDIIGVRYIKQMGQSLAAVSGGDLFYTFQGITRDEQYWIYALLPLRAPALDSYNYDNRDNLIDVNTITQDGYNQLDEYATNLPDDAFFPTLTELDAVITSLNFYGKDGMPESIASRLPDYDIDLTILGGSGFMVNETQPDSDMGTVYFGPNDTEVYGVFYIHNQIDMTTLHMLEVVRFLTDFLDSRPATFDTINNSQGATIPVLGGIHYIETDALTGIFYIPAPQGIPVTGNRLQYEFQGFTRDGGYYVRGSYSIMTDLLPASRDDLSDEDIARATSDDETIYNAYIAEIREILSSATPDDFSPSLDTVIAVFESISFEDNESQN